MRKKSDRMLLLSWISKTISAITKYISPGHLTCSLISQEEVTTGIQKLTKDIRLIHDFSLDQFLYDIFQGDEPNRFIERIAFSFVVDSVDERHMSLDTCNES